MTITVETGAGLSTADAYISVADVDTYHEDRCNTGWTGSDSAKEIAIRVATQYLDTNYTWKGDIKVDTQSLAWPRDGVYDKEGRSLLNQVPVAVKNACAELALKALSSTLVPDTTNANFVKREKVDVLETEYFEGSPTGTEYNFVNIILSGLTTNIAGGSNAGLLRS